MVQINAKTAANKIKKAMIKVTATGEKTIACQCLKTYDQASPEEKKSLPFNCFKKILHLSQGSFIYEDDLGINLNGLG